MGRDTNLVPSNVDAEMQVLSDAELAVEVEKLRAASKLRSAMEERIKFLRNSSLLDKNVKKIDDNKYDLEIVKSNFFDSKDSYRVITSSGDVASERPLDKEAVRLQAQFEDAARVVDLIASDAEYAMMFACLLASAKVTLPDVTAIDSSATPLPQVAPRLWADRPSAERDLNPAEFIRKVYGAWLGHGLARHHVGTLDPVLGRAYSMRIRKGRHPEDTINEFAEGNPYGRLDDAEAGRRHRKGVKASQAKAKAASAAHLPVMENF